MTLYYDIEIRVFSCTVVCTRAHVMMYVPRYTCVFLHCTRAHVHTSVPALYMYMLTYTFGHICECYSPLKYV